MSTLRAILPLAALSAACVETYELELPDTGSAAAAIAVFAERPEVLLAIDLERGRPGRVSIARGERLVLFAYEAPLASLGLVPGTQTVLAGSGRPLPAGFSAFELVDRAWVQRGQADVEDLARAVLIPRISACTGGDGCVRYTLDGPSCETPCVLPTGPTHPDPPDGAEPPVFACPPGWASTATSALAGACAPAPARGCARGELQSPSDPACVPAGAPCPAGQWPIGLPTGPMITWVLAGASGDGSTPASPLGSLSAALNLVLPGGVIAIAKGELVEVVNVPARVELRGACAGETRLVAPAGASTAVTLTGAGAKLRDLGVSVEADQDAVRVASPDVSLEGVAISGGRHGLRVEAERARVEHAAVRGASVAAIRVVGTASVAIAHASFDDNGAGVLVTNGAWAELYDVRITHSRGESGIEAWDSGLEATEVAIDDSARDGVRLEGSRARLHTLAIDRSRGPRGGRCGGDGITATAASWVSIDHTAITGSAGCGVHVAGVSTALIRDIAVHESGTNGVAVMGTIDLEPSTIDAARLVIDRSEEYGLYLRDSSSHVSDVRVRRTHASAGAYGDGLVADGGMATLERVVIEDSAQFGLSLLGTQQDLLVHVQHAEIAGVSRRGEGTGAGLIMRETSGGSITHVEVRDTEGEGMRVIRASQPIFHRIRVLGSHGEGAILMRDTSATISQVLLAPGSGSGLIVEGLGDTTVTGLTVKDARGGPHPHKVAALAVEASPSSAHVEAADFLLTTSDRGVRAESGAFTLHRGAITHNTLGLESIVELEDDVMDDVVFLGNENDVARP